MFNTDTGTNIKWRKRKMRTNITAVIVVTLITSFVFITGCGVTINVEKPDGTKYSYKRRGDQKLENVTFKTPEGAEFSIGAQESTDLTNALNTLNTAIEKLPSMLPIP